MKFNVLKIASLLTLLVSVTFFVLGMCFPILSTHTKLIFKFGYEEVNIFDSVRMFFGSHEYFLGTIILLFTFILPTVNSVLMLYRIITGKRSELSLNLDKWNMLDVFIIALLLLNFKLQSNIMVMELQIGTTFIALSVIFRIITMILIERLPDSVKEATSFDSDNNN